MGDVRFMAVSEDGSTVQLSRAGPGQRMGSEGELIWNRGRRQSQGAVFPESADERWARRGSRYHHDMLPTAVSLLDLCGSLHDLRVFGYGLFDLVQVHRDTTDFGLPVSATGEPESSFLGADNEIPGAEPFPGAGTSAGVRKKSVEVPRRIGVSSGAERGAHP